MFFKHSKEEKGKHIKFENINLQNQINEYQKRSQVLRMLVFVIVFFSMCIYLTSKGDMLSGSGDAYDIWKTITTWGTSDIYYSYVTYKGILSIYPYVWLYKLSSLMGLGDFTFIAIYQSVIIAITLTIIIPDIICEITDTIDIKSKLFELKILFFSLLTCYFWKQSGALDRIAIDVPSSFLFFLSIWLVIRYKNAEKLAYLYIMAAFVCIGLLDSLSGQYKVSSILIMILTVSVFFKRKGKKISELALSFSSYGIVSLLTKVWYTNNIGELVAPASAWLYRGLLYFMDKSRIFYGEVINVRGYQICVDYYGSVEKANEMLALAGMGAIGWSIKEYLLIFLKYPLDFIMIYFEKIFLQISYDQGEYYIFDLILQYIMLWLFGVYFFSIIKKENKNIWLQLIIIISAIASIIPSLVLTVELRYGLSVQALIWGVAILGIKYDKKDINIIIRYCIGGLLFVFACMAYWSAIYAQGIDSGNLLFAI